MAIFTAIATFLLAGTFLAGSTIAIGALAIGLGIATHVGLSYAIKAIAGHPNQPSGATDNFGVQGTLSGGGDIPRSFNLGYSMTAGQLVYANTSGNSTSTPNSMLTYVIKLADIPHGNLMGFYVNGDRVTLPIGGLVGGAQGDDAGYAVPEYIRPTPFLYIKYYDGTQTTADAFLVGQVSSVDRPYPATRVGVGCPYVVVNVGADDKIWNGFPTFKFVMSGVKLYDVSKDSTAGGSGPHRYSDPTTWGGDGDNLPAVQIYNLLHGFYYAGVWFYGLQNMTAARLPAVNWITQIGKCRATVTGVNSEPVTISIASPAVVDDANHGFAADQPVSFRLNSTGVFPTGVTPGDTYYVMATGLATSSYQISATPGGAAIDTSGYSTGLILRDVTGPEPTYRSGLQINVDAQPVNAITTLLTACQGKLSEIGGFYKLHLGEPDSPSFSFTDDDILSSEQQVFRPFFALADSVNGIQGKYPDPQQAWAYATAPAYYRSDLEAKDGNRRLMASPTFDAVPYSAQVQRLQKSAIEEGQRARTHVIVLPPRFWTVEPGDVGTWTSARNSYVDKAFRTDGAIDKANLDSGLSLTEVDPSDFEWDHATEFKPVTAGPTAITPPAPQGIGAWAAAATTLNDASGVQRRPAIQLSWDGTPPGVVGVQYEVRLASDGSDVTKGRTDQLAAGTVIVSESLIPNTAYQARGQYLPSAPRDMLWSDWLDVTTPDVRISMADIDAAISYQVTTLQNTLNDRLDQVTQQIAAMASNFAARGEINKQQVRSDLSSNFGTASAEISSIQTAYTAADSALASDISTVSASVGSLSASVTSNATAIANLNGYAAAQYAVTLNVGGVATGFNLVNGGGGLSTMDFLSSQFRFQHPSVNGAVPLNFMTIGTVNGVTAMGMTGNFFLDGVMNARAIISGTITGSLITAGAVNTAQIAINGVDYTNLITGAATLFAFTNYAAHPVGYSGSVAAGGLAMTVKSGTALVVLMSAWSSSSSANSLDLYVDGSLYKSFGFGSGSLSIPLIWLVTGLSSAAHTFTLNITFGGTGSGTYDAGIIYVQDLRK
jgi:Putative phage tail protein